MKVLKTELSGELKQKKSQLKKKKEKRKDYTRKNTVDNDFREIRRKLFK
jgi:hypothetical protein